MFPKSTKQDAEHRIKISLALKGRPMSEVHRRRISESSKGKIKSESHRKHISETQKRKWQDPLYRERMVSKSRSNLTNMRRLGARQKHDGILDRTLEQLRGKGATIIFTSYAGKGGPGKSIPDIIYYQDGLVSAVDVKGSGRIEIEGQWRVSPPQ